MTAQQVMQSVGTTIDFVVAILVIMAIYYTFKIIFGTETKETQSPFEEMVSNKVKNWVADLFDTAGAEELASGLRSAFGIESLDDIKSYLERRKDALTGMLQRMFETLNALANKDRIEAWLKAIKTEDKPESPWNEDLQKSAQDLLDKYNNIVVKTAAAETGYNYDEASVRHECRNIINAVDRLNELKKKTKKEAFGEIESTIRKINAFKQETGKLVKACEKIDKYIKAHGAIVVATCITTKDKLEKMTAEKQAGLIVNTIEQHIKNQLNTSFEDAAEIIKKLN